MSSREKFIKTSLTEKEEFYSNIIMKDNTDTDYKHAKKYAKTLK